MQMLDCRVADVLRVKFELGLFDQPYTKDPAKADAVVGTERNEEFVLNMQKEALVLLKNSGNTLPLDKTKIKNILVTGPLADETNYAISRYGPSGIKVTSVLAGIGDYSDTLIHSKASIPPLRRQNYRM